MKQFLVILAVMACLWLAGCAPSNVKELVADPSYHAIMQSDYSYQESVQMFKDEMVELGFECVVYSEMKKAECQQIIPGFASPRMALFVQIKEVDANHSTVDIKAHFSYWMSKATCAALKLNKDEHKDVPWACRPRKDGSPHSRE